MAEEPKPTPIDLAKVQTYTGIEADNMEDFQEKFSKKFLTEHQIFKDEETSKRIFGRVTGSIGTGIKQIFAEENIEITGNDLFQPPEAIAKLGLSRLKEKWAAEKVELEKTAGLGADEKIKEFQTNIEKLTNKNKDYEKLLKQKADEFESLSTNQKLELKKFKLNSINKDTTSVIKWNPDKDEFSRKGFLATMSEKYVIDLDENDSPFIVDKATNSRIKAEGSHSTFMSPADVYSMEAIKAGMAAVNGKAGQPPIQKTTVQTDKKVVSSSLPVAGRKQLANTSFKI